MNWDTKILAGSNAKYHVLVWWHDFSVDDRKHFDTNDKNETPRDPQPETGHLYQSHLGANSSRARSGGQDQSWGGRCAHKAWSW